MPRLSRPAPTTLPRPELASPGYGYDFSVDTSDGHVAGHNGGVPGTCASSDIYLDDGYTAVVLTNLADGVETPSERKIHELIRAGK